jgi:AraC family transcriptional regulator, regulatory protein of adaptative response / methylated-DNA-[protein]-cysteine methyltransferase
MDRLDSYSKDYDRIEKAIKYLENNAARQPALAEVAKSLDMSESHFQRLFSRWVGISPKRFLQYITKQYASQLLRDENSLLDVAFDAGLSGPSRLHDLFVNCEAVTPGEYKHQGEGTRISYGFHPTTFGECLLATTQRGICSLQFVRSTGKDFQLEALLKKWPKAKIVHDSEKTRPLVGRIFSFPEDLEPAPLYLYIKGTNFQIKVWEALLKIPMGKAVTYQDVARHIGQPKAERAVGNAVGRNPIVFLIPCHRVIRKMGVFGYYGGGPARKKAIMGWEAAHYNRELD